MWLGLTQTRAIIPHVTHMHIQPINREEEEEEEEEQSPPAFRAGAGAGARMLWGDDEEQDVPEGEMQQDSKDDVAPVASPAAHAATSACSGASELRPLQPLGVHPNGALTTSG